jgi:phosphatidylserine/phosphatidylglycerophosphate/cardiolipin synthase-like enzyme
MMKSAKRELTLLSPYVRTASDVTEWLRTADARGVPIRLVYGKKEMDEAQLKTFSQFRKLKLFYSARLHAKCFYNEDRMIITSLNLLQSSEMNNEFGVMLESDEQAFRDAATEAERVIAASEPRNLFRTRVATIIGNLARPTAPGFCIHCSRDIPLDPDRPYCGDCFKTWARFENWDYAERVCHRCGREETTSRAKPLCYRCYTAGSAR